MIFKAIVQVVLAITMVEFTPYDASQIEQQARLPEAAGRPIGIVQMMDNIFDPIQALTERQAPAPIKIDQDSLGIETTAVSALVYDRHSATTLFEKNIDEVRSIGSITKLMTAYVALESGLDLKATAFVSEEDLRVGGYEYLRLNDQVMVRDILRASLVGSDNSATIALARLTGMSTEEFVQAMNDAALALEMPDTTFTDPTGLSSKNRSTVQDVVRLLDATMSMIELQEISSEATSNFISEIGNNYSIPNTNELLNGYLNSPPYDIVGGKTGYLPEAGYCLGIMVQENAEHDIFVVVLGSSSKENRFREVKGLTQWAYDTFAWPNEI